MQVYRGLDIGSAKPSGEDRRRVPHHLIDVAGLGEVFDAASFVAMANAAIQKIQAAGKRPILCGGTGFYFTALREGLGDAPRVDLALRHELESIPLETLLDELQRTDPATFATIDRRNPRRVIRAVEVIRLSGRPFSAQRAVWGRQHGGAELWIWLGLKRQTPDLHERISQRVDLMFERGLVAETKALLELGLEQNRTAMQAIGYRQVVEHLRGVRSLDETINLVKARTRQFSKRQMTWFRKYLPLEWIEVAPGESAEAICDRLVSFCRRGQADA